MSEFNNIYQNNKLLIDKLGNILSKELSNLSEEKYKKLFLKDLITNNLDLEKIITERIMKKSKKYEIKSFWFSREFFLDNFSKNAVFHIFDPNDSMENTIRLYYSLDIDRKVKFNYIKVVSYNKGNSFLLSDSLFIFKIRKEYTKDLVFNFKIDNNSIKYSGVKETDFEDLAMNSELFILNGGNKDISKFLMFCEKNELIKNDYLYTIIMDTLINKKDLDINFIELIYLISDKNCDILKEEIGLKIPDSLNALYKKNTTYNNIKNFLIKSRK